jgi:hypothetical protein
MVLQMDSFIKTGAVLGVTVAMIGKIFLHFCWFGRANYSIIKT